MARNMRIDNDSKALITAITGFKNGDENFNISLQFIQSSFKFHRYLDVDSHKVNRTLDGICQKLKIHSENEKERQLRLYVSKFLKRPDFDKDDSGRRDIHHSILALLLNLAGSPTSSTYTAGYLEAAAQVNRFDWKSYLLEGAEPLQTVFPPTPDASDSEGSDADHAPDAKMAGLADLAVVPPVRWLASSGEEVRTVRGCHEGTGILRDGLMQEYWKGHADSDLITSTSFARDWERYRQSMSAFQVASPTLAYITEYQVIRETLWLLSGSEGFIYKFDEGSSGFYVRENISLIHLTEMPLRSALGEFARQATSLYQLRLFCKDVANGSHRVCSQTYRAYAFAVMQWHRDFLVVLRDFQTALNQRESLGTVLNLKKHLDPWFNEQNVLKTIHERGVIASTDATTSPCAAAAALLSYLGTLLIEMDSACHPDDSSDDDAALVDPSKRPAYRSQLALVIKLTLLTIRPYLDMVDNWLTKGVLVDAFREFVIQRSEDLQCSDARFWDCGWKVHSEPSALNGGLPTVPYFIEPLMPSLLVAGKSVDVLASLGRMTDVSRRDAAQKHDGRHQKLRHQAEPSLYGALLAAMMEHMSQDGCETPSWTPSCKSSHPVVSPLCVSSPLCAPVDIVGISGSSLDSGALGSTLLDANLRATFEPFVVTEDLFTDVACLLRQIDEACASGRRRLRPLQPTVVRLLRPIIERRCSAVSCHLLGVLVKDHCAVACLAAARKYYFMEASDAMYNFCRLVFEKLKCHEAWMDIWFLNETLRSCLLSHHQKGGVDEQAHNFSIVLNDVDGASTSEAAMHESIKASNRLSLQYKVDWPVSLLFDEPCLKAYGDVFSFLLQVKRAKYLLDHLKFCDLGLSEKSPTEAPVRKRMLMLRMRLLYFVNGFHDYIMTQVVHSSGLEFDELSSRAINVDELLEQHRHFVRLVYDRCLLDESAAKLRYAVLAVLAVAVAFQVLWDGDEAIASGGQQLSCLEMEYSRSVEFLSVFLSSVVKRRSSIHLESLAYVLLSAHQQR